MHTVALSSELSEESYSIQKTALRQRRREWQRETKVGGVWEDISVNEMLVMIAVVFSWKRAQGPLSFQLPSMALCTSPFGIQRTADALARGSATAFWLQLKGSSHPDFYYVYTANTTNTTTTHTRTSKSLACMTGDGQKQIMVIDRCLEMDLCVFMRVRTEDWD